MKSNQFSNLVYLPWLTGILKSLRCDIIDWHYDRGLNNSKLTVWSSITVADGGMRVWHFNGVITTYGIRDCRNSWRYASFGGESRDNKAGFYCTCWAIQAHVSVFVAFLHYLAFYFYLHAYLPFYFQSEEDKGVGGVWPLTWL